MMNIDEIETLWTFYNVGGSWIGRRQTGQKVRAETRTGAIRSAQNFEKFPW